MSLSATPDGDAVKFPAGESPASPPAGVPEVASSPGVTGEVEDRSEPGIAKPGSVASRGLEITTMAVAVVAFGALLAASRNIVYADIPGQTIHAPWWPSWITGIGLALALAGLARSIVGPLPSREDVPPATSSGYRTLAATVALTIVYTQLWPWLGFLPTTFVFLGVLQFVFGARKWWGLLLFPAVVTGVLWVIFSMLLKVAL